MAGIDQLIQMLLGHGRGQRGDQQSWGNGRGAPPPVQGWGDGRGPPPSVQGRGGPPRGTGGPGTGGQNGPYDIGPSDITEFQAGSSGDDDPSSVGAGHWDNMLNPRNPDAAQSGIDPNAQDPTGEAMDQLQLAFENGQIDRNDYMLYMNGLQSQKIGPADIPDFSSNQYDLRTAPQGRR